MSIFFLRGKRMPSKNKEVIARKQKKYDEAHRDDYKAYYFKCHRQQDADIIEFLEAQSNKQGTIKELIRKAIK